MLKPPLALSPQARRERNRAEMTAAILTAAREVMRAEGAAALNLHEVARRVGLQTPSLYAYFESKAALYDALFRLGVEIWSQRIEQVYQRHGPTWDTVEATFRAFMEFGSEYPELYQIVFERPVPGFVPSEEAMAASLRLLDRGLDMITQAIELGNIHTNLPPEQARDLLIVLMEGLTSLHIANEPELPADAGRFGSLLPAAIALVKSAWGSPKKNTRRRTR